MNNLSCLDIKQIKRTSYVLSFVFLTYFAAPSYGFQLDLSSSAGNLTDGNADGVGATMRFNDVGTENGTSLDLVITTLDSYQFVDSSRNGTVKTNDGRINIRNTTSTTFKFSLVIADSSPRGTRCCFSLQ